MVVCETCRHENRAAAKFCEECGFPLALAPARGKEQRKTVTVLFCDLAGSTVLGETLDPERLHALLARYYARMKSIVERHGGSVEKFIGDAVMAVFGVPLVREDDAVRAVRSAVEMRDALPELGLEGRIGVMTGEVVTGTEERLATGDAVNVAARLEQAAQAGEVLIGQPTLALARDTAEVEPVAPLVLKGKAELVFAYRLLRVRDAPERSHDSRFVGRERELALVREAWERVRTERHCELVTVVGDAGVGKSRLVAEALAPIDATVVRGRCLPYGEGITYWPVVEVLKQLDVLPPEEVAAAAMRSLLGESETATSAEEIAWAFRKTLEHAASERPLVVLFDDIQWGEETFRQLVEHVALLSSDGPLLLVCMARPELSERHPGWPVTLRLGPLGDENVEELIPDVVASELRERIVGTAAGNPLFVQEMLAMAREAEGEVVVPPTLRALLAARLDQLDTTERNVLERGSIEGEIFHRGAVQALAPEETHVTPRLAALVRKELIRAEAAQLHGEDGFRFRHLLIRDAAYNALPKAVRATLHAGFAGWLEQHGSELAELDEVLGYHLERACLYRADLGLPVDEALAAAARARLTAAGRRAAFRQDFGAGVRALERAATLLPSELDVALEIDLADALFWGGRRDDALLRAGSIAERAAAAGDRAGELCGRIQQELYRLFLEPEGATAKLGALVEQALPVFEAAGDDLALYLGYSALGHVANTRGQSDARLLACEQAYLHAQRAGLPHDLIEWRGAARFNGTSPLPQLLAWLDEQEKEGARTYYLRSCRAGVVARLGRFDEARSLLTEVRAELAERGGGTRLATTIGHGLVDLELLADDPAAAVELGEEACRLFDELGEKNWQAYTAGRLAQALYALDRLNECEAWADRTAELGGSDDALAQMLSGQAKAKVLARRGQLAEAERLARHAVAIGEETDMLEAQADAYADLAEVLALAGRTPEASEALTEALHRHERKGNVVSAQRARARLMDLRTQQHDLPAATTR
jgi:class 3 adenylate cyclase